MFDYKRIPLKEGIEIVVEELAARRAKEEHRVTCYDRGGYHVSGAEFDTQDRSERKGMKIKTFPIIEKRLDSCECLFLFTAICSPFGRYGTYSCRRSCIFLLASLLMGKAVVTVHGFRLAVRQFFMQKYFVSKADRA